jgi:hypothetical protein
MGPEYSRRPYPSPERARQQLARKAGLASGRKRRQLANPQRRRMRQRELALKFPVRIVDREEFERRDFERRLRAGLNPNERGTETLWQEYQSCVRAFRAQGQGFLTTNGQRAEALCKHGRPRCGRTVQRAHGALREMGLLRRFHDRRGGSRVGNRDRLRIQFAPSFVTPPSAATTAPRRGLAVVAHRPDTGGCAARKHGPAPPGLSAPPDGGRHGTPAAPANGNGSDKEENFYESAELRQLTLALTEAPAQSIQELAELAARARRDGISGLLQDVRGGPDQ